MRTLELDIIQGDDYTALLNVTHQGAPFDLTGYTVASMIRRQPADSDPTVDATFTCTITGGTIMLTLAHAITAALSGAYGWDCQITETATGLIRTIARGPVNIIPEYTR